jgi:hypothetical protein
MAFISPKPDWLDGVIDGNCKCDSCEYETNDSQHLGKHNDMYHNDKIGENMILYMQCDGLSDGRNKINNLISARWIDCTGGQSAYENGNLNQFGDELVIASRATGIKIYHAYKMADPGLGLDFPQWWIDGGVKAGVFQKYELPKDVLCRKKNCLIDSEKGLKEFSDAVEKLKKLEENRNSN